MVTIQYLTELVEQAKAAPVLCPTEELIPDENLYFRYLWTLARTFKPKLMVEYGTWKGRSAMYLAEGNPDGWVFSMDDLSLAKHLQIKNPLLDAYKRKNVTYLIQDCMDCFNFKNIDLLFMDGNHADNVKDEYEYWLPKMAKEAIILIDDINFNERIRNFWETFDPSIGPIKGEKISLPELHTWGSVGFGVICINKPFEGSKEKHEYSP